MELEGSEATGQFRALLQCYAGYTTWGHSDNLPELYNRVYTLQCHTQLSTSVSHAPLYCGVAADKSTLKPGAPGFSLQVALQVPYFIPGDHWPQGEQRAHITLLALTKVLLLKVGAIFFGNPCVYLTMKSGMRAAWLQFH